MRLIHRNRFGHFNSGEGAKILSLSRERIPSTLHLLHIQQAPASAHHPSVLKPRTAAVAMVVRLGSHAQIQYLEMILPQTNLI
jgi:hypothetical protein